MDHIALMRAATQTLIDHVDELTALDQAIGDGDHGLNMRRGAQAIQAQLDEWQAQGIPLDAMLKLAGTLCMRTIGGSSGPVFGTLLLTLAKELPAQPGPREVGAALAAAIGALTRLGKAQVGQKTLLDVLDPVQRLLEASDPAAPELLDCVRGCAFDSAAATADMDATRGRASFLGDRALGHVDPGSRSVALIVAAICDGLATTPQSSPPGLLARQVTP